MSRHNKVNRDRYTQRGRLTPDDAARELQKMRQVGSQHTWQPTKKDALPRRESKDPAAGTETTEDNGSPDETFPEVAVRPASAAQKRSIKTSPVKAKALGAKSGAAKSGKAKKTGKAKTVKAAKRPAKSAAAKPKRKAVLARNVGGGGAKPRPTPKRRKS